MENDLKLTVRKKPKKTKHLGLHIDNELHYKLHYVSDAEGRSVNGEVLFVLRQYIVDFEAKYGSIEVPPEG